MRGGVAQADVALARLDDIAPVAPGRAATSLIWADMLGHTIPAAAYLGVAAGIGYMHKVWGAMAVLAVNVAILLVSRTITLLVQRRLAQRATA